MNHTPGHCLHSFPDPYPQPMTQPGNCRGCGISYQEARNARPRRRPQEHRMRYYLALFLHLLADEPHPPRCGNCQRFLFTPHTCPERSSK